MQLEGIVRLGGRDIGLVELSLSACEGRIRIATLALQPGGGSEGGRDHVGFVVGLELGFYICFFRGVSYANRIGGGFGGLESVCDSQRNVLAVVADNVVFERRAALIGNAFESRSKSRA